MVMQGDNTYVRWEVVGQGEHDLECPHKVGNGHVR